MGAGLAMAALAKARGARTVADAALPKAGGTMTGAITYAAAQGVQLLPVDVAAGGFASGLPAGWVSMLGNSADANMAVTANSDGITFAARAAASWWSDRSYKGASVQIPFIGAKSGSMTVYCDSLSDWTATTGKKRFGIGVLFGDGSQYSTIGWVELYRNSANGSEQKFLVEEGTVVAGTAAVNWGSAVYLGDAQPGQIALKIAWSVRDGIQGYYSTNGSAPTTEINAGAKDWPTSNTLLATQGTLIMNFGIDTISTPDVTIRVASVDFGTWA